MRDALALVLAPIGEAIGQLSYFYGFCCRIFHIKPHHEVFNKTRRQEACE